MISPFKRISNLYKLSGISVHETSPKADALSQIADVFKSPEAPKPKQRLATIISLNEPENANPEE